MSLQYQQQFVRCRT